MIATEIKILIDNGVFKKLLSAGVISANVNTQFDMYELYEKKRCADYTGQYDWEAIESVAIFFKCANLTVYRAIKIMQQR